MEDFRLALVSGVVLRKFLWEALRWRQRQSSIGCQSLKRPHSGVIKLIKTSVLAFIVVQTLFLDLFPISGEQISLRIVGMIIYLVGLTTSIIGRLHLGKNWVDLEDYQVLPEQSLVTEGIYRFIRHPIYTGDILLLSGLELALNSWLVLAVPIPFLIALRQTMAEEALLAQVFPDYSAYCKRTKRFIPFII